MSTPNDESYDDAPAPTRRRQKGKRSAPAHDDAANPPVADDGADDDLADFAPADGDAAQDDDGPRYDRPSKSQVKRDMHALLDLGKRLVALSDDQLKRLPLSDRLYESIRLAQRTTSREGRRRQIHFVGKLMRQAPAQAIQTQLHEWEHGSRAATTNMHRLEAMRDQLMTDDQALTRLIDEYPQADARTLHGLVRNARQEARRNAELLQGQDPQRKHYRALFQALRQLDTPANEDGAADAATDDDATLPFNLPPSTTP